MSKPVMVLALAVSLAVHAAVLWGWPMDWREADAGASAEASEAARAAIASVMRLPEVLNQSTPKDEMEKRPEDSQASSLSTRPEPVKHPASGASVDEPGPPLESLVEPTAKAAERGSFSGSLAAEPDEVSVEPALRIDWGSTFEAVRVMSAGGMRLVVIGGGGGASIRGEVVRQGGGWAVRGLSDGEATGYSNRLRIVDGVPAFEAAGSVKRAGERLAVLVPPGVERMLTGARRSAVSSRGVSSGEVRAVAGRFVMRSGGVGFEVSDVLLRRRGES